MRLMKLILLSLFVIGLSPVDVLAQGVSGRGVTGGNNSQASQACQIEVDNMRNQIRQVTRELDILLNCNRQGKINILGTTDCRDIASPAHEWTGTTLAFGRERTGETAYDWAAGVDLKGDKGPKGDDAICYSPGDTPPPPPPPPGNDSCTFTYFDSGNVTVSHGNTASAYTTPDGYKAGNNMCNTNRYTVRCNDGSFSLVSGNYNRTPAAIVPSPSASIDRGYKNCEMCGSYDPDWCDFGGSDSCGLPWGGMIDHGESVTAYQASQAPACRSETRSCNDGTLSGSYQYQNCIPGGGGGGSRCCNYGVGWYECGNVCCHNSRSDNRPQHPSMLCDNPDPGPSCCPEGSETIGYGRGQHIDGYWGWKCRDRFGDIFYAECR